VDLAEPVSSTRLLYEPLRVKVLLVLGCVAAQLKRPNRFSSINDERDFDEPCSGLLGHCFKLQNERFAGK
jgi:hypothetical protein